MKKYVLLSLFLLSMGLLFAYVYGGTNLGFSGYPSFSASAPSAPYGNEVSEWEYDSYRERVLSYVSDAEEYVENGNNDIHRISEAQDDAIEKANEAIRDFNAWSSRVTIVSRW